VWIGLGAGLRRAELLGLRWEDVEYLNPDLGVLVVQRRVNYLGKGINRLERDGLKNGDPFKRVHVGSLMLDVLRMRWLHQLVGHLTGTLPLLHEREAAAEGFTCAGSGSTERMAA